MEKATTIRIDWRCGSRRDGYGLRSSRPCKSSCAAATTQQKPHVRRKLPSSTLSMGPVQTVRRYPRPVIILSSFVRKNRESPYFSTIIISDFLLSTLPWQRCRNVLPERWLLRNGRILLNLNLANGNQRTRKAISMDRTKVHDGHLFPYSLF